MAKDINEIKNLLEDRVCVILGAGPSIEEGLDRIPKDAFMIGINEHLLVRPINNIKLDMTCSRAHGPSVRIFNNYQISNPDLIKISTWTRFSDYEVKKSIFHEDRGYSGTLGVYVASHLNAKLIILLGMDIFQSDKRYWYTKVGQYSDPSQKDLNNMLEPWVSVKKNCKNSDRIRIIGCHTLLRELFGEYSG